VKYGQDRKAWLIFAAGIVHAAHVQKAIEGHGIPCKVIVGDTPSVERDTAIKEFRDGKIKCIVNVGVLTTGFNAPVCDLIALLMATQSTGKYVQIVGRGMRPFPGKKDCLLMDYGNNVVTHGAIDDVDPVRTRNIFNIVKKAPPIKQCQKCNALIHAAVMTCPACGFEFPVTAPHGTEAYSGNVMSSKEPFLVELVGEPWYSLHRKPGKPDILKISLVDKVDREFPIWCCLDHIGYAKMKADAVVKQFGGTAKTVSEALKEYPYWKKPYRIKVVPNGKFFNIIGMDFAKQEVQTHMDIEEERETPLIKKRELTDDMLP
jgi:DNA repair protein RadD